VPTEISPFATCTGIRRPQELLPVYLDEEVSTYLRKQAETKGKELNEIVNEMLKNDIDLIKATK